MTKEKNTTLVEKTLRKLEQFNSLEAICREHDMLPYDTSDISSGQKNIIESRYQLVLSGLPSTLSFSHMSRPGETIAIHKHARYIPEKPHKHLFIELFYIFSGSCIHRAGGTDYHLQSGDFCFWQPFLPHSIHVTSDMDQFLAVNILLEVETLETLFQNILSQDNPISRYFSSVVYGNASSPILIFRTDNDPDIAYLLCLIYQEYQNTLNYYQPMMYNHLMELFLDLLRDHSHHVYTYSNTQEKSKPDAFLPVLQYIQENYTSVTLGEVCDRFHYSSAYLSRAIKKNTGYTFSQIVTENRMILAEKLLSSTELSITDIAQKCGYYDASHFNSVFTRYHALSPRKYRNDAKSQECATRSNPRVSS